MKSIVAVLSVFIGCNATAQNVRPGTTDAPAIDPQLIQMEQITVSGFEVPNSLATATAADSIPDAPHPMRLPASIRTLSIHKSRPVDFTTFRSNNFNRSLVATEFLTRGLDALSTHKKLNDPCRCYREASRFFGLDMTPVVKSEVGAYSYSLGVAAVYSLISARLWNAGKTHPKHARLLQRLSRSLLIIDSSVEMTADIHNLNLMQHEPSIRYVPVRAQDQAAEHSNP